MVEGGLVLRIVTPRNRGAQIVDPRAMRHAR